MIQFLASHLLKGISHVPCEAMHGRIHFFLLECGADLILAFPTFLHSPELSWKVTPTAYCKVQAVVDEEAARFLCVPWDAGTESDTFLLFAMKIRFDGQWFDTFCEPRFDEAFLRPDCNFILFLLPLFPYSLLGVRIYWVFWPLSPILP